MQEVPRNYEASHAAPVTRTARDTHVMSRWSPGGLRGRRNRAYMANATHARSKHRQVSAEDRVIRDRGGSSWDFASASLRPTVRPLISRYAYLGPGRAESAAACPRESGDRMLMQLAPGSRPRRQRNTPFNVVDAFGGGMSVRAAARRCAKSPTNGPGSQCQRDVRAAVQPSGRLFAMRRRHTLAITSGRWLDSPRSGLTPRSITGTCGPTHVRHVCVVDPSRLRRA